MQEQCIFNQILAGSGSILYASALVCGPVALAVGATVATEYFVRWWLLEPELLAGHPDPEDKN